MINIEKPIPSGYVFEGIDIFLYFTLLEEYKNFLMDRPLIIDIFDPEDKIEKQFTIRLEDEILTIFDDKGNKWYIPEITGFKKFIQILSYALPNLDEYNDNIKEAILRFKDILETKDINILPNMTDEELEEAVKKAAVNEEWTKEIIADKTLNIYRASNLEDLKYAKGKTGTFSVYMGKNFGNVQYPILPHPLIDPDTIVVPISMLRSVPVLVSPQDTVDFLLNKPELKDTIIMLSFDLDALPQEICGRFKHKLYWNNKVYGKIAVDKIDFYKKDDKYYLKITDVTGYTTTLTFDDINDFVKVIGPSARHLLDEDEALFTRAPQLAGISWSIKKVIVNRDPQAQTIYMNPLQASSFNADYDGDSMKVFTLYPGFKDVHILTIKDGKFEVVKEKAIKTEFRTLLQESRYPEYSELIQQTGLIFSVLRDISDYSRLESYVKKAVSELNNLIKQRKVKTSEILEKFAYLVTKHYVKDTQKIDFDKLEQDVRNKITNEIYNKVFSRYNLMVNENNEIELIKIRDLNKLLRKMSDLLPTIAFGNEEEMFRTSLKNLLLLVANYDNIKDNIIKQNVEKNLDRLSKILGIQSSEIYRFVKNKNVDEILDDFINKYVTIDKQKRDIIKITYYPLTTVDYTTIEHTTTEMSKLIAKTINEYFVSSIVNKNFDIKELVSKILDVIVQNNVQVIRLDDKLYELYKSLDDKEKQRFIEDIKNVITEIQNNIDVSNTKKFIEKVLNVIESYDNYVSDLSYLACRYIAVKYIFSSIYKITEPLGPIASSTVDQRIQFVSASKFFDKLLKETPLSKIVSNAERYAAFINEKTDIRNKLNELKRYFKDIENCVVMGKDDSLEMKFKKLTLEALIYVISDDPNKYEYDALNVNGMKKELDDIRDRVKGLNPHEKYLKSIKYIAEDIVTPIGRLLFSLFQDIINYGDFQYVNMDGKTIFLRNLVERDYGFKQVKEKLRGGADNFVHMALVFGLTARTGIALNSELLGPLSPKTQNKIINAIKENKIDELLKLSQNEIDEFGTSFGILFRNYFSVDVVTDILSRLAGAEGLILRGQAVEIPGYIAKVEDIIVGQRVIDDLLSYSNWSSGKITKEKIKEIVNDVLTKRKLTASEVIYKRLKEHPKYRLYEKTKNSSILADIVFELCTKDFNVRKELDKVIDEVRKHSVERIKKVLGTVPEKQFVTEEIKRPSQKYPQIMFFMKEKGFINNITLEPRDLPININNIELVRKELKKRFQLYSEYQVIIAPKLNRILVVDNSIIDDIKSLQDVEKTITEIEKKLGIPKLDLTIKNMLSLALSYDIERVESKEAATKYLPLSLPCIRINEIESSIPEEIRTIAMQSIRGLIKEYMLRVSDITKKTIDKYTLYGKKSLTSDEVYKLGNEILENAYNIAKELTNEIPKDVKKYFRFDIIRLSIDEIRLANTWFIDTANNKYLHEGLVPLVSQSFADGLSPAFLPVSASRQDISAKQMFNFIENVRAFLEEYGRYIEYKGGIKTVSWNYGVYDVSAVRTAPVAFGDFTALTVEDAIIANPLAKDLIKKGLELTDVIAIKKGVLDLYKDVINKLGENTKYVPDKVKFRVKKYVVKENDNWVLKTSSNYIDITTEDLQKGIFPVLTDTSQILYGNNVILQGHHLAKSAQGIVVGTLSSGFAVVKPIVGKVSEKVSTTGGQKGVASVFYPVAITVEDEIDNYYKALYSQYRDYNLVNDITAGRYHDTLMRVPYVDENGNLRYENVRVMYIFGGMIFPTRLEGSSIMSLILSNFESVFNYGRKEPVIRIVGSSNGFSIIIRTHDNKVLPIYIPNIKENDNDETGIFKLLHELGIEVTATGDLRINKNSETLRKILDAIYGEDEKAKESAIQALTEIFEKNKGSHQFSVQYGNKIIKIPLMSGFASIEILQQLSGAKQTKGTQSGELPAQRQDPFSTVGRKARLVLEEAVHDLLTDMSVKQVKIAYYRDPKTNEIRIYWFYDLEHGVDIHDNVLSTDDNIKLKVAYINLPDHQVKFLRKYFDFIMFSSPNTNHVIRGNKVMVIDTINAPYISISPKNFDQLLSSEKQQLTGEVLTQKTMKMFHKNAMPILAMSPNVMELLYQSSSEKYFALINNSYKLVNPEEIDTTRLKDYYKNLLTYALYSKEINKINNVIDAVDIAIENKDISLYQEALSTIEKSYSKDSKIYKALQELWKNKKPTDRYKKLLSDLIKEQFNLNPEFFNTNYYILPSLEFLGNIRLIGKLITKDILTDTNIKNALEHVIRNNNYNVIKELENGEQIATVDKEIMKEFLRFVAGPMIVDIYGSKNAHKLDVFFEMFGDVYTVQFRIDKNNKPKNPIITFRKDVTTSLLAGYGLLTEKGYPLTKNLISYLVAQLLPIKDNKTVYDLVFSGELRPEQPKNITEKVRETKRLEKAYKHFMSLVYSMTSKEEAKSSADLISNIITSSGISLEKTIEKYGDLNVVRAAYDTLNYTLKKAAIEVASDYNTEEFVKILDKIKTAIVNNLDKVEKDLETSESDEDKKIKEKVKEFYSKMGKIVDVLKESLGSETTLGTIVYNLRKFMKDLPDVLRTFGQEFNYPIALKADIRESFISLRKGTTDVFKNLISDYERMLWDAYKQGQTSATPNWLRYQLKRIKTLFDNAYKISMKQKLGYGYNFEGLDVLRTLSEHGAPLLFNVDFVKTNVDYARALARHYAKEMEFSIETVQGLDNELKKSFPYIQKRIEYLQKLFKMLGLSESDVYKALRIPVNIKAGNIEELKMILDRFDKLKATGLKFDIKVDESTMKKILQPKTFYGDQLITKAYYKGFELSPIKTKEGIKYKITGRTKEGKRFTKVLDNVDFRDVTVLFEMPNNTIRVSGGGYTSRFGLGPKLSFYPPNYDRYSIFYETKKRVIPLDEANRIINAYYASMGSVSEPPTVRDIQNAWLSGRLLTDVYSPVTPPSNYNENVLSKLIPYYDVYTLLKEGYNLDMSFVEFMNRFTYKKFNKNKRQPRLLIKGNQIIRYLQEKLGITEIGSQTLTSLISQINKGEIEPMEFFDIKKLEKIKSEIERSKISSGSELYKFMKLTGYKPFFGEYKRYTFTSPKYHWDYLKEFIIKKLHYKNILEEGNLNFFDETLRMKVEDIVKTLNIEDKYKENVRKAFMLAASINKRLNLDNILSSLQTDNEFRNSFVSALTSKNGLDEMVNYIITTFDRSFANSFYGEVVKQSKFLLEALKKNTDYESYRKFISENRKLYDYSLLHQYGFDITKNKEFNNILLSSYLNTSNMTEDVKKNILEFFDWLQKDNKIGNIVRAAVSNNLILDVFRQKNVPNEMLAKTVVNMAFDLINKGIPEMLSDLGLLDKTEEFKNFFTAVSKLISEPKDISRLRETIKYRIENLKSVEISNEEYATLADSLNKIIEYVKGNVNKILYGGSEFETFTDMLQYFLGFYGIQNIEDTNIKQKFDKALAPLIDLYKGALLSTGEFTSWVRAKRLDKILFRGQTSVGLLSFQKGLLPLSILTSAGLEHYITTKVPINKTEEWKQYKIGNINYDTISNLVSEIVSEWDLLKPSSGRKPFEEHGLMTRVFEEMMNRLANSENYKDIIKNLTWTDVSKLEKMFYAAYKEHYISKAGVKTDFITTFTTIDERTAELLDELNKMFSGEEFVNIIKEGFEKYQTYSGVSKYLKEQIENRIKSKLGNVKVEKILSPISEEFIRMIITPQTINEFVERFDKVLERSVISRSDLHGNIQDVVNTAISDIKTASNYVVYFGDMLERAPHKTEIIDIYKTLHKKLGDLDKVSKLIYISGNHDSAYIVDEKGELVKPIGLLSKNVDKFMLYTHEGVLSQEDVKKLKESIQYDVVISKLPGVHTVNKATTRKGHGLTVSEFDSEISGVVVKDTSGNIKVIKLENWKKAVENTINYVNEGNVLTEGLLNEISGEYFKFTPDEIKKKIVAPRLGKVEKELVRYLQQGLTPEMAALLEKRLFGTYLSDKYGAIRLATPATVHGFMAIKEMLDKIKPYFSEVSPERYRALYQLLSQEYINGIVSAIESGKSIHRYDIVKDILFNVFANALHLDNKKDANIRNLLTDLVENALETSRILYNVYEHKKTGVLSLYRPYGRTLVLNDIYRNLLERSTVSYKLANVYGSENLKKFGYVLTSVFSDVNTWMSKSNKELYETLSETILSNSAFGSTEKLIAAESAASYLEDKRSYVANQLRNESYKMIMKSKLGKNLDDIIGKINMTVDEFIENLMLKKYDLLKKRIEDTLSSATGETKEVLEKMKSFIEEVRTARESGKFLGEEAAAMVGNQLSLANEALQRAASTGMAGTKYSVLNTGIHNEFFEKQFGTGEEYTPLVIGGVTYGLSSQMMKNVEWLYAAELQLSNSERILQILNKTRMYEQVGRGGNLRKYLPITELPPEIEDSIVSILEEEFSRATTFATIGIAKKALDKIGLEYGNISNAVNLLTSEKSVLLPEHRNILSYMLGTDVFGEILEEKLNVYGGRVDYLKRIVSGDTEKVLTEITGKNNIYSALSDLLINKIDYIQSRKSQLLPKLTEKSTTQDVIDLLNRLKTQFGEEASLTIGSETKTINDWINAISNGTQVKIEDVNKTIDELVDVKVKHIRNLTKKLSEESDPKIREKLKDELLNSIVKLAEVQLNNLTRFIDTSQVSATLVDNYRRKLEMKDIPRSMSELFAYVDTLLLPKMAKLNFAAYMLSNELIGPLMGGLGFIWSLQNIWYAKENANRTGESLAPKLLEKYGLRPQYYGYTGYDFARAAGYAWATLATGKKGPLSELIPTPSEDIFNILMNAKYKEWEEAVKWASGESNTTPALLQRLQGLGYSNKASEMMLKSSISAYETTLVEQMFGLRSGATSGPLEEIKVKLGIIAQASIWIYDKLSYIAQIFGDTADTSKFDEFVKAYKNAFEGKFTITGGSYTGNAWGLALGRTISDNTITQGIQVSAPPSDQTTHAVLSNEKVNEKLSELEMYSIGIRSGFSLQLVTGVVSAITLMFTVGRYMLKTFNELGKFVASKDKGLYLKKTIEDMLGIESIEQFKTSISVAKTELGMFNEGLEITTEKLLALSGVIGSAIYALKTGDISGLSVASAAMPWVMPHEKFSYNQINKAKNRKPYGTHDISYSGKRGFRTHRGRIDTEEKSKRQKYYERRNKQSVNEDFRYLYEVSQILQEEQKAIAERSYLEKISKVPRHVERYEPLPNNDPLVVEYLENIKKQTENTNEMVKEVKKLPERISEHIGKVMSIGEMEKITAASVGTLTGATMAGMFGYGQLSNMLYTAGMGGDFVSLLATALGKEPRLGHYIAGAGIFSGIRSISQEDYLSSLGYFAGSAIGLRSPLIGSAIIGSTMLYEYLKSGNKEHSEIPVVPIHAAGTITAKGLTLKVPQEEHKNILQKAYDAIPLPDAIKGPLLIGASTAAAYAIGKKLGDIKPSDIKEFGTRAKIKLFGNKRYVMPKDYYLKKVNPEDITSELSFKQLPSTGEEGILSKLSRIIKISSKRGHISGKFGTLLGSLDMIGMLAYTTQQSSGMEINPKYVGLVNRKGELVPKINTDLYGEPKDKIGLAGELTDTYQDVSDYSQGDVIDSMLSLGMLGYLGGIVLHGGTWAYTKLFKPGVSSKSAKLSRVLNKYMPIIGTGLFAAESLNHLRKGEYMKAAVTTTALLASELPIIGAPLSFALEFNKDTYAQHPELMTYTLAGVNAISKATGLTNLIQKTPLSKLGIIGSKILEKAPLLDVGIRLTQGTIESVQQRSIKPLFERSADIVADFGSFVPAGIAGIYTAVTTGSLSEGWNKFMEIDTGIRGEMKKWLYNIGLGSKESAVQDYTEALMYRGYDKETASALAEKIVGEEIPTIETDKSKDKHTEEIAQNAKKQTEHTAKIVEKLDELNNTMKKMLYLQLVNQYNSTL